MAKQITVTSKYAKTYVKRERACKAVEYLERDMMNDNLIVEPLRFVITVCPETGRYSPVIIKTTDIEDVLMVVVEAGFTIVG